MNDQRLFVAQIVVANEDQWFAPGMAEPPIRSEKHYLIEAQLFSASDEEDAYRIASNWITNGSFSDSNHDGLGDLTQIFGVGIHNIEEIVRLNEIPNAINDLYGLSLPVFAIDEIDQDGVPLMRAKHELEIFRVLRLKSGSAFPNP